MAFLKVFQNKKEWLNLTVNQMTWISGFEAGGVGMHLMKHADDDCLKVYFQG